MNISAEAIRRLVELDLGAEQLKGVMSIISDMLGPDKSKELRRERNRRYYERKCINSPNQDDVKTVLTKSLSPKKDIPPTPPIEKITPLPVPPECEKISHSSPSEPKLEPDLFEAPIDLKTVRAAKAAEAQKLLDEKAEEFYRAYPKHVDPKDAKKAFVKTVRSGVAPEHIIASATRFAARHKRLGTDKQFIAAPAVWLNKGSYDNEDLTPTRRLITADELWSPA